MRNVLVDVQSLEDRQFLSSVAATVMPLAAASTPQPSEGGLSLTKVANEKFTARLGEFTQKVVDLSLNAAITWGDGTQSDGKLVGSYATGEYYVEGAHTYKLGGNYKVDVKIYAHPVGSPRLPTDPIDGFTSVVKVLQASKGGRLLNEYAGQKFDVRLGEITQKVTDLALNAVIDWGDGTKSDGKMTGSYETGEYYISGTHTYAKTGNYKVKVGIYAHPVGSPIQPTDPITGFTSVIEVHALVPTTGGKTLTEHATKQFTENLGEFHQKVSDLALNAVIDWGDGTKSDGKIEGSYATGDWYVEGTHKYAHTGTYKVDVKIFAHPIGSPQLATSPISRFLSVIKVIA